MVVVEEEEVNFVATRRTYRLEGRERSPLSRGPEEVGQTPVIMVPGTLVRCQGMDSGRGERAGAREGQTSGKRIFVILLPH